MRRLSALIFLFMTTSAPAEDMGWVSLLMAKEAAYTMIQTMSLLRTEGHSWDSILGQHLSNQVDETCGYRERTGFGENLTPAILDATKRAISGALVDTYSQVFSRPNAKMHLFDDKITDSDDIVISLRVVPGLEKDPWFNLFYRLGDEGSVRLCDIGVDDLGGLRTISRELFGNE